MSRRLRYDSLVKVIEYHRCLITLILLRSLLHWCFLSTTGEGSTIYTNASATSTSHIKKYLLRNSVCQNKVRTLFDPGKLAQLDSENLLTAISSESVPTPPVDSLGFLCPDRL